ncbi:hypothetical protein TWF192_000290 [Orbilia oligospora]|nr:hypothetical protein TWF192_000290 [Orbilia oligospora]
MWVDGNIKWQQLLAGIAILKGYHVSANGDDVTNANPGGNGDGNGNGGGITPTWGQSPGRGFTFPSPPFTPQTGMQNTLDTSRTSYSGMANSLASGRGNSFLLPPNVNPLLSQPGRILSSYRPRNYDNSYSIHRSNSNSPDNSGYDSPDGEDLPETEPDELLYPRIGQRTSLFSDNPSRMLEKGLFDRGPMTPVMTLGTAIKALGIKEPEENIKNIWPLIDLQKTPPTSGANTPRYDLISGQTTPRYGHSGQNTPRYDMSGGFTSRHDSRRTSRYGSPLARDRFTIADPISVASMEDDEGNVEDEEELAVNVPVFGRATDYPGLEFTGPKKVNPIDVDTGTIFMSATTEKDIPAEPGIPSLQSIPQDTTDPLYAKAFVITPGGASSAATKINAIVSEKKDYLGNPQMILVAQYRDVNPNPSKWIVDKANGGVLRLAGTPYFVYLCHRPSEKVPFLIGNWNEFNKVSKSCFGENTGSFYYMGWEVVPSTPKAGLPATAAEAEVQFNNPKLKSLNKEGVFNIRFPPGDKDYLWDTAKDGRIRLPRYVQVTTLPSSKVKQVVGTAMSEDRRFWMYVGNVIPTGNDVPKGWTVAEVLAGDPIQIQASVPRKYPMSWFLTEIDPKRYTFGPERKYGAEVAMASLEGFPKPGVWSYNVTRNRIYKLGTKRFIYTCRSEDKGGAFLLSGLYAEALKDCGKKDWIHPIHPKFEDHIGSHGRLSVSLGKGVVWVTPDPDFTTPGLAYNEMGVPLVGRLMTLGKPDYSGMSTKKITEAKVYRAEATIITEVFVVDNRQTFHIRTRRPSRAQPYAPDPVRPPSHTKDPANPSKFAGILNLDELSPTSTTTPIYTSPDSNLPTTSESSSRKAPPAANTRR